MFEGSKLKLDRAIVHLAALEELFTTYDGVIELKYKPIDGDKEHFILGFEPSPPVEIPLIIGDAVHNMRAALDLMICDIDANNGFDRDSAFPFAKSETAFLEILSKKKYFRLGEDIIGLIKELKPFLGGNLDLYALHDLDIIDKHRLVIPTMCCAFGSFDINAHLTKTLSPSQSFQIDFLGNSPFDAILSAEGDKIPNDPAFLAYYTRTPGGLTAIFAEDDPFSQCHVRPTLLKLHSLTTSIVDKFEAVCKV